MAKRKRRSKSAAVSAATVTAIKARKRAFLADVSSLLSDALGFAVRVSMVPPKLDLSPSERRASRMTKSQARRSIRDSAGFGASPPISSLRRVEHADGTVTYRTSLDHLDDPLSSALLGGDADEG